MSKTLTVAGLSLVLAFGAAQTADAQGWGDRLKNKVKQKVDQRADQAADRAVDKTLDKAEDTIKCAATDQACIDKAKAEGKQVEVTGEAGGQVSSGGAAPAASGAGAGNTAAPAPEAGGASAAAPAAKPGEGAWANYDFKPGERVLVFEDFTKDEVGNFPRRFQLKKGNAEIVEWQGGRYLSVASDPLIVEVPLPEKLPERFTLEFDFYGGAGGGFASPSILSFQDEEDPQVPKTNHVVFNNSHAGIDGAVEATTQLPTEVRDQLYKLRVMADGGYAKVYVNERRVANVPNANFPRSNKLVLYIRGNQEKPAMLGNVHIAAGGKKLYDALAETGRVATQGILFDTGSDRIRPESTPTLKEIGTMLKEHADLKLTIEGHTDNVGDAAVNQALSEKRAAAVKEYLVTTFGIDDSRLTAKGFGAIKPAASNDTPEGRQTNRRVELVKM